MKKFVIPLLFVAANAQATDWQHLCLAKTIYWEARGESIRGQYAVAQVVLNRVASPKFKNTICGVVYKPRQFSWTHIHKHDRISEPLAWQVAKIVAKAAIEGLVPDLTHGATYYHADYVRPSWRKKFQKTVKIGKHIFYKTK